jgi:CBS domain-containing protein
MEMKIMENNKLIRMAEKTTAIKSLKDLVRARTSENSALLIDVSGSMAAFMRNGKTRIAGLREVVAGLQSKRATPMIAFGLKADVPMHPLEPMVQSEEVGFVTEVPDAHGGTPMGAAIRMAAQNGFGRLVVISDGGPTDDAMGAAMEFGGRIDVIFVGDPGSSGSAFLDAMAKATGGQRFEGDLSDVKEITGAVVGLLNGEVLEEEDDDDDDEDDDDDDDEDDDEDEE